jgi:predicted PurR-regulated permease PerM
LNDSEGHASQPGSGSGGESPGRATTRRSPARGAYLRALEGLVLIVAVLYLASAVIVPLALAIMLTVFLAPLVSAIQRCGLKRLSAVIVVALFAFVFLGLVGCIVGMQIHSLARELPTHQREIEAKIAGLRGDGTGTFSRLMQMIREIGKGEPDAASSASEDPRDDQVTVARPQEASSFEQLANAAGPVLKPLTQAGLIVVLVIFMLTKREDLRNRIIGLLGHGRLTGTTRVLVDSTQRLSRYLLAQLLINLGFGALFAVGLFFFGVPYAFLWGFLSVVLRFVPYIGSTVAVAFPLVLAFAVAPDWTQPLLVLALFLVLELITVNIAEPLLIGHGTGVSPIALLVAAAFWTWVWGPVGLVLSTPLTVCLVTLGQHVPRLRFFALLLGDKPALEPHVSYYQRLVAQDQEEAKQVAVDHVQSRGLENVYDEVLLPAVALARRDRKQAGLSAEDEGFIFRATRDIMDALESVPPAAAPEPEPASEAAGADSDSPTAAPAGEPEPVARESVLILGCPAHHESEELCLSMLARLLEKDGCRVEVVSTKVLPAEVESRVASENPALVFVAILPPGGIVQARFLCRCLRKRSAELPIVVGYWGDGRQFDKILVRLRAAGASYVATSLLQGRSQIRALLGSASPAVARPSGGGELGTAGRESAPERGAKEQLPERAGQPA